MRIVFGISVGHIGRIISKMGGPLYSSLAETPCNCRVNVRSSNIRGIKLIHDLGTFLILKVVGERNGIPIHIRQQITTQFFLCPQARRIPLKSAALNWRVEVCIYQMNAVTDVVENWLLAFCL